MFKEVQSPLCPMCNMWIETAHHQLVCQHPDRTEVWKESISQLHKSLIQYDTNKTLIHLIIQYVQGRGGNTLSTILAHTKVSRLTKIMDTIGWFNILEGKIPKELMRMQAIHYTSSTSLFTIKSRGIQLVTSLLETLRAQWKLQREEVHKRDKDSLLKQETALLRLQIRSLHNLDDNDLEDEDEFLLRHSVDDILNWDADGKNMGTGNYSR